MGNHRTVLKALPVIILSYFWISCSKMDATYKQFVVPNGVNYIQKASSVNVYPGRNRVKITWLRGSDPKTKKAIIYWNNRADSLEVPVTQVNPADTVQVIIDGLPENSYNFDIYTLDKDRHASIAVNAMGNSYGDSYESSLLIRPVNTLKSKGNNAEITWFTSDTTSFTSELHYTDKSGNNRVVQVPMDSDTTELEDYDFGTAFYYRSFYKPDVSCLDTFYTAFDTLTIYGPPVDIPKNGWTATASSEDAKTGRVATNAIDGNINTLWFSGVATGRIYPHSLTVDMGQVFTGIFGFSFAQRLNLGIKEVEFKISQDGRSWTSLGIYTLSESTDMQYLDFPAPQTARYFEVVCLEGWKDDPNASIMETGVFTR